MNKFIVINGKEVHIIFRENMEEAKTWCENYCNHSEEVIVREFTTLNERIWRERGYTINYETDLLEKITINTMKITKKDLNEWVMQGTGITHRGSLYRAWYNGRNYFLRNAHGEVINIYKKSPRVYGLESNR